MNDLALIDPDNPVLDFTAMDRCASCGAQAITLATHEELGEFLFCKHHRDRHEDHLLDTGWKLIDDMYQMEMLYS